MSHQHQGGCSHHSASLTEPCSARSATDSRYTAGNESCCCQPAQKHEGAAHTGSSQHDCCSSADCEQDGEVLVSEAQAGRYRRSWHIKGMDCPSCAQKIENAVGQLTDIADVRVRFATEKLEVEFDHAETAQAIEQRVLQTGFEIRRERGQADAATQSRGALWHPDNLRIAMLTGMMLIAAALQWWHPAAGQGVFAATCLVGLLPIAAKAWRLIRSGTPFAIETLMTVAALGALYLGETAEAAMVMLLFLIGERLEAFAASRARSGVQSLMALVPDTATCLRAGERVTVAVSDLRPGDIVEVGPGGRLPADGRLRDAMASIDESALTGEPLPVERGQGDTIVAGSVVVDRVIEMEVTSRPGNNAIDRILHLIEEAESHKAPVARFIDSFSRWYTPLMMAIALLVVVVPPVAFAQPWETWVYRGLAMLLIACPCALVISTPAAITSGLAAAASRGALIKGGAALEKLGRIDVIAFDKTGTLTLGKPQVTDVIVTEGWSSQAMLRCVAALEQGSTHPLALSVLEEAAERQITVPQACNKQTLIGRGVCGDLDGHRYQVVAPAYLEPQTGQQWRPQMQVLEQQGKTVAAVLQDEEVIGVLGWQDAVREDARQAIAQLHALGVSTTMLTGDNAVSAGAIAAQLGIAYQAGLLPQDKVSHVAQMAQQQRVAMVGDGINDAPAMKAAYVGIAMGGGTDVALEAADAALTHNRLTELAGMLTLSRAVLHNITQNVALALGLKGLFLVTSLLGMTGLWVAVLADSGATALVTLNALRLLKFRN